MLLQVVAAASIFSVLSLGVANLIIQQQSSITYLEDQLEKTSLVRNVESIMKDNTGCKNTFLSTPVNLRGSTNIPDLNDSTGNVLIRSNTRSGNLMIGQITLINNTIPGPNSSGLVSVDVPIRRARSGRGPENLSSIRNQFTLAVDASNRAVACNSSSTGSVTIRTGSAPGGCSCNADEIRTGCTGTVRRDGDTYATGSHGCSADRASNVQCICFRPPS